MGDDYSDHDQVLDPLKPECIHDVDPHLPWQARLGEEGPSLASELKHLDRAASRPCLVQVMLILIVMVMLMVMVMVMVMVMLMLMVVVGDDDGRLQAPLQ